MGLGGRGRVACKRFRHPDSSLSPLPRYVARKCNKSAPPSTVSPALTKISSTTPSAGAGISFSIFIASSTSRPRSAADFGAFFDQHARDAAGHERFDDAAVAEVIVAAFAAEGERIDDLDVESRRSDRDLVRRPFAMMRERGTACRLRAAANAIRRR